MKTLQTLIFSVLIVAAGYAVGCSSDGTGPVPPGVLHGAGGSTEVATSSAGGSEGLAGATSSGGTLLGGAASTASALGGASTAAGGTNATTSSASVGLAGATAQGGATGAGGAAGGSIINTATSTGTSTGGSTGTGGTRSGGTTGGTTISGGTLSGGTTGTGGTRTGGTTSTGTSSGTGSWWPAAFNATTLPNPSNGNHNAGKACLSCHVSGGQAPSWLFGGTTYDSAGTTGVAHLQIGIKDGTKFFSAYSATNGNIWLPTASNTVNWANAEIRLRSATGEKIMGKTATSGDCNSCHSSGNRILTP
jgi:hypothetical protein